MAVPLTPGGIADATVDNPAATVLLPFLLLVGVDWIRHGADWDRTVQRAPGYAMAGFLFLLLATVAPDVARAIVFGMLILAALSAAGPLVDALNRVVNRVNTGTAAGGARVE